ncbi:MAG: hypothetical protein ACOZIN_14250 [Myxococcota bacterium]
MNGTCEGATDGGGGGGNIFTGCDSAAADNSTRDTDCDGISDADEYALSYGANKTDPCNSDSDGDGIKDGVEVGRTSSVNTTCSFTGDADSTTKTDPTVADSDGDGVSDGDEDKNKDGKVDPGESDPTRKDSDCDGISDADELAGTFGCATDPLKRDSDGDGLHDGVEQGLQAPGVDPTVCTYDATLFDVDPAARTNACNADSDNDGIADGAEDLDGNGRTDPGELNPNDPVDAQGPVAQACATANLKPISFHSSGNADVQVALVPSFTEVSKLTGPAGELGILFYDPTNQVIGMVFSKTPTGASATNEETAARSTIGSQGALTGAITQTFTTWDGYAASVRATYNQGGNADLKARANAIAQAFLGQNVGGILPGAAGVTGPFKIQAEYVRRDANHSVVLIALSTEASYVGGQIFRLDDVAGGSALAQFGDFTGTQCEVFTTSGNANVDFIWVVDNSGSMGGYQQAVGNVGNLFSQKLGNAGLNWRVAGIGTDGQNSTAFTTTVTSAFFTAFGTGGSGIERQLLFARNKVTAMLPKQAADVSFIRTSADLHVILLGDADDQDGTAVQTYIDFFNNYDGAGSKAVVHGIVCPQGQTCGEAQRNPRRNLAVITATGGIQGDINSAQPAGNPAISNTLDAILSAAIAGTGRQLARPPISATIKIAIEANGTVGACNTADVPRDRTNGFDFDSATRRVVFFGDCRPNGSGKKVAVSYRFWNDGGDPCGNRCVSPLVCNPETGQCVCPANCGGSCASNETCNMTTCVCEPGIG